MKKFSFAGGEFPLQVTQFAGSIGVAAGSAFIAGQQLHLNTR